MNKLKEIANFSLVITQGFKVIRLPYILGVMILLFSFYLGFEMKNNYIIILSALLIAANFTSLKQIRQKNDLFNIIVIMSNCLMCIFIAFEVMEIKNDYYSIIFFISAFIFLIATYIIYKRNLRPFKKFSSK